MSVNRFRPHVLVLPEDDANRQLANGFFLDGSLLNRRSFQILPVAGGWVEVLHRFKSNHISGMERYHDRIMVLLIDFDSKQDRLKKAQSFIPAHLTERVFILGAKGEPEELREATLGSYETIGLALAKDCREETNTMWGHNLLQHNASELERLREQMRPLLFSSA